MFGASTAIVAAESILALTPIAIKLTQLDPVSQIWSRTLSTTVLGYAFADDHAVPRSEWAGAGALGYANLLHIASSYEAFRNLPAGQAMSLLYTYPLWNLVFNQLFHNTKVTVREYGLMAVAALGSIVLNLEPGHAAPTPVLGKKASQPWGIAMGLTMALTESAMHVILRILGWRDPAKSVWVVNGGASVWLGLLQGVQALWHGSTDGVFGLQSGTWADAAWLTAFHSLTMFSGYWLRFYAVPRLSVTTYSILSYAGLLASYLFGLIFLGERPGWMSLVGAAMILVSGLLLQLRPGSA
jgi:drug/metabolite transporter (DMT)-like permease